MAHFRFDKTENWNLDTVTAVNLRPKHVLPGPSKTTSRVLRILATIWDLGSEGHPKQWREPSSCQVLTDASIIFSNNRNKRQPTNVSNILRAHTHTRSYMHHYHRTLTHIILWWCAGAHVRYGSVILAVTLTVRHPFAEIMMSDPRSRYDTLLGEKISLLSLMYLYLDVSQHFQCTLSESAETWLKMSKISVFLYYRTIIKWKTMKDLCVH